MEQLVRRYKQNAEAGFGLVELLVAFALVGIVLAGASKMFVNIMFANASVRDNAIIISEVQEIIDNYRTMPYTEVLDLYETGYLQIQDGDTYSSSQDSASEGVDYTITLTAVKSMEESIPEAIEVNVSVDQARWKFSTLEYNFTTLISQVS